MKIKPEVILDDEHELVIERVCAIDVAKASGRVCVRLRPPGEHSVGRGYYHRRGQRTRRVVGR